MIMTDLPIRDKKILKDLTPQKAMEMLRAGNARYAGGKMRQQAYGVQRQQTAEGQYPYAIVLSCIDSRVIPEVIFDTGIGELFVARIAGNIINRDILGSMEYACVVTGSKVIVVLGHTSCGAVKGAVEGVVVGNLTGALRPLQLAVAAAKKEEREDPSPDKKAFIDRVARRNVEITLNDVRGQSTLLRDMEEQGEIIITGAMYDHVTGKVSWM